MFCVKCGKAIPDGGAFCNECGSATTAAAAPAAKPPKRGRVLIPFLLVMLIIVLVGMVNDALKSPEQRRAEEAVERARSAAAQEREVREALEVISGGWEIVSIGTKVTERNNQWSRYAWKLVLKNGSRQAQTCTAVIEFHDADGFIVDTDRAYGLAVPAGGQKTFTGFALVTAAVAGNVERVSAKIR